MKREPFAVNVTPSSDPPKRGMEELWLDDADWGTGTSDPFISKDIKSKGNSDDPFADMDFEDPFAAPPKKSSRSKPQAEHLSQQREALRQSKLQQDNLSLNQQRVQKKRLQEQKHQEALRRRQKAQKQEEQRRAVEAELLARKEQARRQQAEEKRRQELQRQQEVARQRQLQQDIAHQRKLKQEALQREEASRQRKRDMARKQEAIRQAHQAELIAKKEYAQRIQKEEEKRKLESKRRQEAQQRQLSRPPLPHSHPLPPQAVQSHHSRQESLRPQAPQKRSQQVSAEYTSGPRATQPSSLAPPSRPNSQPPISSGSSKTISPQQLQNILIPMHQLMRNQAEEIKQLKHALHETQKQTTKAQQTQQAQQAQLVQQLRKAKDILLEKPKGSESVDSSLIQELKAELAHLQGEVKRQAAELEIASVQASQASSLASMNSYPSQAGGGNKGLGNPFKSVGSWVSDIGSKLSLFKPNKPKTFEELKAITSSGDLPLPPPVPVYDPFNENTPVDRLNSDDTPVSTHPTDGWHEETDYLHRPVVTNAPKGISSEHFEGDESTPRALVDEFKNDQTEGDSIRVQATGQAQVSQEEAEKSKQAPQEKTSSIPVMGQNDPSALEFSVGGLTMSRFQPTGPDPQVMAMLSQHTQLLKRQDYNNKQLSGKIKSQEEMNQTQNEIIEQLISRTQRESDKLKKRVNKLEKAKDISQANAKGLKVQHKRLSQLEMLIEGFEAKLAAFDEKLSAKDPTKQATDIRVSLDPDEGDYQSIQEAIDAAPVGAYIGVMPGIYEDPLEFTKPVKIIGLGRPQDILIQVKEECALTLNRMGGVYEESMTSKQEKEVRKKLQQYTSVEQSTVGSQVMKWFKKKLGQPAIADQSVFEDKVGSDEVSLVSLTIASITTEVGGIPSERPAILIRSGHLRLEKCEVRCENGHGIVLEGESAELTTRASRIFQAKGSGLILRTRAQATLASTSIIKCKESGIDGQGYTSIRLMDCDISNNQRTGVQAGFKSQIIAYHTTMAGNHFEGLWMNNQSTGTVKNCDLRGNARGPYDISTDCRVEMLSNKP